MSADRHHLKYVRSIADYQFGAGVGERLFPEGCEVRLSKRTGRPRHVFLEGRLLATVRPDGLLALTLDGAKRLAEAVPRPRFRVVVAPRAARWVRDGRDVRCGDVCEVDEELLPGEEALVEDAEGNLIAVGRAVVSASTMRALSSGVAVRVRRAVKG